MPPDELNGVLADAGELRERVLDTSSAEELVQVAIKAGAGWAAVRDFVAEHPEFRDDLKRAAFAFGFVAELARTKLELVQRVAYGPASPIARALSMPGRPSLVAQQRPRPRPAGARPRERRARRSTRSSSRADDSDDGDPPLAIAVPQGRP